MKIFAALLFVGILAGCAQDNPSPAGRGFRQFDYRNQIGVVFWSEDQQLRLEIKDPDLVVGDAIVVVDPNRPQKVAKTAVIEKVTGHCSKDGINDSGDACYRLRIIVGGVDQSSIAFGIASPGVAVVARGGVATADLENDKVTERFRSCASQEGLHLTVWSGLPITGKRRWHRYFYLGYDLEPNCRGKEAAGPED